MRLPKPGTATAVLLLLLLAAAVARAQRFSERGYLENLTTFYPETAQNDSGRAVSEMLLRFEASYQVSAWLKLNGAIDARTDTHRQVDRDLAVTVDDRSMARPALSLRRLSLLANKGKWTVEAGRQFIRWGRADILNPEDRFAPKDFLNVVSTDFLGVTAARVTYESGANTVDLVAQPWFTPSRTPLIHQRWTVLPEPTPAIHDAGSVYPSRVQYGVRWNHTGRGYEAALSYFDGFNHLPLIHSTFRAPFDVDIQRYYSRLRQYGGDFALPTRWVTVKAEAAYYRAPAHDTDEYVLYVVQLERQQGNWVMVGGYAGDAVTKASGNPLAFSPELGFARSLMGRAEYTIGATRSVAFTLVSRQNGKGSWLRSEYSHAWGRNWRGTAGFTWIRGDAGDFLGQYHRNSYASLAIRYSF